MIATTPFASGPCIDDWSFIEAASETPEIEVNSWLVTYRETVFGGDSPLGKMPAEVRNYGFNFSRQKELAGGDSLTGTPTITATRIKGSGTLTIGTPTIAGKTIYFSVSGGEIGDRFELRCVAATLEGWTLEHRGQLLIIRNT